MDYGGNEKWYSWDVKITEEERPTSRLGVGMKMVKKGRAEKRVVITCEKQRAKGRGECRKR